MNPNRSFIGPCLSALIFLASCSGLKIGSDVQAGRSALQTGDSAQAVIYLSRAAESDPNYKFPSPVHESVLTYLGRAYYETGEDGKARAALERALMNDKNDPLAHLYFGLTLYRGGDREQGRKEIEAGLNSIHAELDELAADGQHGILLGSDQ